MFRPTVSYLRDIVDEDLERKLIKSGKYKALRLGPYFTHSLLAAELIQHVEIRVTTVAGFHPSKQQDTSYENLTGQTPIVL